MTIAPALHFFGGNLFWTFLHSLCASPVVPMPLRWRVLLASGLSVRGVGMEPGVRLNTRNIEIGLGAYLNRGVTFSGAGRISIGPRAAIGPDVLVTTETHAIGSPRWRAGDGVAVDVPVTIGAGAWIGARATILPGVTIGPGCVIAAGSVVTRDCAPHSLYAGVPAVFKRKLPTDER